MMMMMSYLSGYTRETAFLFQRLSVIVQCFNSVVSDIIIIIIIIIIIVLYYFVIDLIFVIPRDHMLPRVKKILVFTQEM